MTPIRGKLRLRAQALRRAEVSPPKSIVASRELSDGEMEELCRMKPGAFFFETVTPSASVQYIPPRVPVWRTVRSRVLDPLRRSHV